MSTTDSAEDTASPETGDGAAASEQDLQVDAGDGDEEHKPIEVEFAPPRLSQGISMGAATVGAALTTAFTFLSIPFGIGGLAVIAGGLFLTHSIAWVTAGTALVLTGAIVTGGFGAVPPELFLIGIGASLLGWDVGQHGIVIGRQVGRTTQSVQNQLTHTAASLIVIGLLSTMMYAVYLVAGEGRPAAGVAVLVLGVIVLAWVFRS